MRSSSVKTLVITVSMFAVVSAASITAEARPVRPAARTTVSAPRRDDGALSRAVAALRALQKRFLGVISNAVIGPPLPSPDPSMSTTNGFDPLSTVD